MHLYDQLQQHFIIPNAYTNWKNYREELTQSLIKETNQITLPLSFHANMAETDWLPTLLIVGAGACNDLDLQQLLPHYSHITLLDSNSNSMQQALHTYHLTEHPDISCLSESLIGITDEHYMELCDELQFYLAESKEQLSPQSFAKHAVSLVNEQLAHRHPFSLPERSYDYVCCFGVHSQLLAMYSYIYHAFDVNLRDSIFHSFDPSICDMAEANYMNYLKEQNDQLIPELNTRLLSCATRTVWIGLEQQRTNDSNHSPIEGARQALDDLAARKLPFHIRNTVWPFYPDGNISYDMQIIQIPLV